MGPTLYPNLFVFICTCTGGRRGGGGGGGGEDTGLAGNGIGALIASGLDEGHLANSGLAFPE